MGPKGLNLVAEVEQVRYNDYSTMQAESLQRLMEIRRMSELSLRLGKLHLDVKLLEHQVEEAGKPYLDWLVCAVSITVPSFSGDFRWSVMPAELLALADKLQELYDQFPKLDSVNFIPVERNVALSFEIGKTGIIEGQYTLCDDLVAGATLRGPFTIDQSYLPGVVRALRAFVREASS